MPGDQTEPSRISLNYSIGIVHGSTRFRKFNRPRAVVMDFRIPSPGRPRSETPPAASGIVRQVRVASPSPVKSNRAPRFHGLRVNAGEVPRSLRRGSALPPEMFTKFKHPSNPLLGTVGDREGGRSHAFAGSNTTRGDVPRARVVRG